MKLDDLKPNQIIFFFLKKKRQNTACFIAETLIYMTTKQEHSKRELPTPLPKEEPQRLDSIISPVH
jgi:hypothetical protein